MTIYEVTVVLDPALAEAFERYMRTRHIPEILATGCFTTIRFERAAPTKFRTRYESESRARLEEYLDRHTDRFRADFMAHFPEGCDVLRATWEEVQRFGQ
jgi:hypothetical protein